MCMVRILNADKASQWYFLVFQIILELEKQRIEILCNILSRYNLQMSSFGQTLKHVRHPNLHLDHKHPLNTLVDIITVHFCCFQGQRQIEQAVQRVDMDKDIKALVEENNITTENHKAEFLMADYFVSLPFICLGESGDKLVCEPQTRPFRHTVSSCGYKDVFLILSQVLTSNHF